MVPEKHLNKIGFFKGARINSYVIELIEISVDPVLSFRCQAQFFHTWIITHYAMYLSIMSYGRKDLSFCSVL